MIRNDTPSENETMDTVKVGYAFSGFRNDGRYFVGLVDSVRETAKGTLVVLHSVESSDDGVKPVYKSLYLNTMETYTCREVESWPAGLTRAEYLADMRVVGA